MILYLPHKDENYLLVSNYYSEYFVSIKLDVGIFRKNPHDISFGSRIVAKWYHTSNHFKKFLHLPFYFRVMGYRT